ncbi:MULTISPECIES: transposase [unclassified Streptomyces]|uniref:transposase n=1 Tax=unclassified Streptomyces TaxID=2593676 RepID=UPI002E32A0BA|nr:MULTISPECIES: transposase [unclassified Streptomyces]
MGSKSNRSRQYTEEVKRDAVALVHSSGKTVTEVARRPGVCAEGLRNWVKQDATDRGQGAPGELTTAEREELRRLRRVAAEQAETIEVLRKAAVFFAKESDR